MGEVKLNNSNSSVGWDFIDALVSKYKSEILIAKATLRLYTNDLSAIGEHSDLITEQDKWLGKYVDAKDKLEAIYDIYDRDEKING